ncbi:MAG: hypothetical protein EU536_05015, partial [Promethearchaeota archaeon]
MSRKKKEETEKELDEIPPKDETKAKDTKKEDKVEAEKPKKEKWEKIVRSRIEVDFWKTDLHGKKIGVRQKDQQMARSRQFSKDMNIYGDVKIDKKDAGHIGYRTNEWEEKDINKGDFPRLIVRYFSEGDRWIASIEQNNLKSLMLSIGYERGTPVFDIFHQGDTNVYSLEKIERGTASMDRAMLPLILTKDGKDVEYFVFKEKRFSIGSDWELVRANDWDKELVDFDSKKFNIGG